jgi:hypothetical protein
MAYLATKPTKSKGIAILLVIFFGPLGLFYSTVSGGIIMTLFAPAALLSLFIKGAIVQSETVLIIAVGWTILAYILCFLWAIGAVDNYNRSILISSMNYMESSGQTESVENIYENLERIKRLLDDGIIDQVRFDRQKGEYLERISSLENRNVSGSYYNEYYKAFPEDNSSIGVKNMIIVILLIALCFSIYMIAIK